jgi:hypothetical protein
MLRWSRIKKACKSIPHQLYIRDCIVIHVDYCHFAIIADIFKGIYQVLNSQILLTANTANGFFALGSYSCQ